MLCFSLSARGQTPDTLAISGDSVACVGSYKTYTFTPDTGVTYKWSITNSIIIGGTPTTVAVALSPAVMTPLNEVTIGSINSATVLWRAAGTATVAIYGYSYAGNLIQVGFLSVRVAPLPQPIITTNFKVACKRLTDDKPKEGEDPQFDDSGCLRTCAYNCVTYYAIGQLGSTYDWSATGGSVSFQDADSAVICWDGPAFGTVTVKEITEDGCEGEGTRCVEIIESPIAHFVALPDTNNRSLNICDSTEVIFIDKSYSSASSPITSWKWDFGDGTYSSAKGSPSAPISHMYTGPGHYIATLTVTNSCGCSTTETMDINVDPNVRVKIECPTVVCEYDTGFYSVSTPCAAGNWSVIGGTPVVTTPTTISVVWDNVDASGFGYVIYDAMGCGIPCDFSVAKVPVVLQNGTIDGPTVLCPNSQYLYRLPQWPSTKFDWSITSATGATWEPSDQPNEMILVTDGPGTVIISCNYTNTLLDCGGSATLFVTVRPGTELTGPTTVCLNTQQQYDLTSSGSPINGDWELTEPDGGTQTDSGVPSFNGQFDEVGTYILKVTGNFCEPTPLVIRVNELPPPVDEIIGPDTICKGVPVRYYAQYPLDGTIINWSISGGGTVNSASKNETWVTLHPDSTGPFVLSAWRETKASPHCRSEILTKAIDTPVINLQIMGPDTVCRSTYYYFHTNYTKGEVYQWSIYDPVMGSIAAGDGTAYPRILWNETPGVAYVICKMRKCFAEYIDTMEVYVRGGPAIQIIAPSTVCMFEEFTASLTEYGSGARWDFGDSKPQKNGFTSPIQHTYEDALTATQSYTITAEVANPYGCQDTETVYFNYIDVKPAPIIEIDSPRYVYVPCSTTVNMLLTASVTGAYGATNWQWIKVGTGVVGSSSSYLAVDYGMYIVHAWNSATNCISADTVEIIDGCCDLSYAVSVSVSGILDSCGYVTLTSSHSTTGYFDYLWRFPPEAVNVTTGPNAASAHFEKAGVYPFVYSAYYSDPPDTCVASTITYVTVPYIANADYVASCTASGGNRGVTLSSIHSAVVPVTSNVIRLNGSIVYSGSNPTYTTNLAPGTYFMEVIISGGGYPSCWDTMSFTIYPLPNADFTHVFDSTCVRDTAVVFTNTSTSMPELYKFLWNFGDGAENKQRDPHRVYQLPTSVFGTYTVKLWVTDRWGCIDSVEHDVYIKEDNLNGGFTASPSNPCQGDPVTLSYTNLGSSTPTAYHWMEQLDEIAITNSTPHYVFESGMYWVKVYDKYGCNHPTQANTVDVTQVPFAYIAGDKHVCVDEDFTLGGYAGSDPDIEYQWFLNGSPIIGATSADYSDNHGTAGTYTYRLVVRIPHGMSGYCDDSSDPFVLTVHDNPDPPSPAFNITGCQPYTVELYDPSPLAWGSYTWSNGLSGIPAYSGEGGAYLLTYTDTFGCSSSQSMYVDKDPSEYLWIFPTGCISLCLPSNAYITGPIIPFYEWDYKKNGMPVWGTTWPFPNYTIPVDYTNFPADAPGMFSLYLHNGYCSVESGILNVDTLCQHGPPGGGGEGKPGMLSANEGAARISGMGVELTIAPNPARNSAEISYEWLSPGSNRYIEVYDITGKLVERTDAPEDKGSWLLPLDKYMPGVYQVVLKQDGNVLLHGRLSVVK